MDSSDRRSMDVDTLYNTLFLRANWRVVEHLLHRMAAELAAGEGHGANMCRLPKAAAQGR